jgi:hypothetical protein
VQHVAAALGGDARARGGGLAGLESVGGGGDVGLLVEQRKGERVRVGYVAPDARQGLGL